MEYYHDKSFRDSDGKITGGVVQGVATKILEEYGYERKDENQIINNDIYIYDTGYFANKENYIKGSDVYTIHYFDGSWCDVKNRGMLYKLARKYDLMQAYRKIEQVLSKKR